jgi:hypothetical protein
MIEAVSRKAFRKIPKAPFQSRDSINPQLGQWKIQRATIWPIGLSSNICVYYITLSGFAKKIRD